MQEKSGLFFLRQLCFHPYRCAKLVLQHLQKAHLFFSLFIFVLLIAARVYISLYTKIGGKEQVFFSPEQIIVMFGMGVSSLFVEFFFVSFFLYLFLRFQKKVYRLDQVMRIVVWMWLLPVFFVQFIFYVVPGLMELYFQKKELFAMSAPARAFIYIRFFQLGTLIGFVWPIITLYQAVRALFTGRWALHTLTVVSLMCIAFLVRLLFGSLEMAVY